MRTFKALLLDFERQHCFGNELREVLTASEDPRFEVILHDADESNILAAAGVVPERVVAFTPALTFLVFDRVPDSAWVAALLERLQKSACERPSIVVAPAQSSREVVGLFRQGVFDVWLPPLRAVEVLGRAAHWLERLPQAEDRSIQQLKARLGLDQLIGESPALLAEIRKIPAIASCDASALIYGETGTGKEICARSIHYLSPRSGQPFVPVNCGAVPENLMDNELFGHERGAFTGANTPAAGLIEQAGGGTLFLDEIDSLPLSAQVKLLRFLQEKEYRRLGSRQVQSADVRIIAATNANLESLVRTGRLRQDLYYRLRVVELTLPPLRERGGDVVLLALHFLKKHGRQFRRPAGPFTTEAMRKLQFHSWPGNVRELEHVVMRAILMSPQPVVRAEAIVLPKTALPGEETTFKQLKAQTLWEFERKYLTDVLRSCDGNISKAAMAAGKERRTFWQLLRKHRLTISQPEQKRP